MSSEVEAAFERSEREYAEAVRNLNIADANHIEIVA